MTTKGIRHEITLEIQNIYHAYGAGYVIQMSKCIGLRITFIPDEGLCPETGWQNKQYYQFHFDYFDLSTS